MWWTQFLRLPSRESSGSVRAPENGARTVNAAKWSLQGELGVIPAGARFFNHARRNEHGYIRLGSCQNFSFPPVRFMMRENRSGDSDRAGTSALKIDQLLPLFPQLATEVSVVRTCSDDQGDWRSCRSQSSIEVNLCRHPDKRANPYDLLSRLPSFVTTPDSKIPVLTQLYSTDSGRS